jgi:hypothetical protein
MPFSLGRFHLHPQKAPLMLDPKVIGRGISLRLGDAQSVGGGSRHETHLGPLALLLAVLDINSSIRHEGFFLGNAGLGWVPANKKARPWGRALVNRYILVISD